MKKLSPGTLDLLGLLNIILGLTGTALCLAALAMLFLHGRLGESLPESSAERQAWEITRDSWVVYMPLGALLGVLFAGAGRWLRRGDRKGRTASWLVTLALAAWYVSYSRDSLLRVEQNIEIMGDVPSPGGGAAVAFTAVSVVGGAIALFAYPMALLFVLQRPFPEAEER